MLRLKRLATLGAAFTLCTMVPSFAYADLFESTPPESIESTNTTTTTIGTEKSSWTFYDYWNYLFNNTTQPAWQTRTNFFYDVQQKNTPVTGFETIQPIWECYRSTVFGQGRAGYTDGDTVFNFGLGNRYITPNRNLMLGFNVFYDEVFRYPHKRVGLGAEVFTRYFTFRGNFYDAYTGQHYAGDNTYERAALGYDASVETPVPYIPWMRFTIKGYHWKGNRIPNVNGGLINFRFFAARQVEFQPGYAYDNSQHSQWFLNFNYYFGAPDFIQYSASTPYPCLVLAPQDLEKIRLEKVIRTNQIVVEKYQGTSTPVIIARTD